jgi:hypothetical protein
VSIGKLAFHGRAVPRGSMSAYYYSGMRELFVGVILSLAWGQCSGMHPDSHFADQLPPDIDQQLRFERADRHGGVHRLANVACASFHECTLAEALDGGSSAHPSPLLFPAD